MVMAFMTWLEMSGNGAQTGIIMIIIKLWPIKRVPILKDQLRVMTHTIPISIRKLFVEDRFFAMILIAQVIGLLQK
jgi:hypothetical protein